MSRVEVTQKGYFYIISVVYLKALDRADNISIRMLIVYSNVCWEHPFSILIASAKSNLGDTHRVCFFKTFRIKISPLPQKLIPEKYLINQRTCYHYDSFNMFFKSSLDN